MRQLEKDRNRIENDLKDLNDEMATLNLQSDQRARLSVKKDESKSKHDAMQRLYVQRRFLSSHPSSYFLSSCRLDTYRGDFEKALGSMPSGPLLEKECERYMM